MNDSQDMNQIKPSSSLEGTMNVAGCETNANVGSYQKELLKYPEEVQAAINEIFPSDDPLDALDFDPVDYINEMFPTEQSLVNLDDVLSDYNCKIQVIDEDMRRIVRGQTSVGEDAAASLEEAQVIIPAYLKCVNISSISPPPPLPLT
jgi:hypothetical protein